MHKSVCDEMDMEKVIQVLQEELRDLEAVERFTAEYEYCQYINKQTFYMLREMLEEV